MDGLLPIGVGIAGVDGLGGLGLGGQLVLELLEGNAEHDLLAVHFHVDLGGGRLGGGGSVGLGLGLGLGLGFRLLLGLLLGLSVRGLGLGRAAHKQSGDHQDGQEQGKDFRKLHCNFLLKKILFYSAVKVPQSNRVFSAMAVTVQVPVRPRSLERMAE